MLARQSCVVVHCDQCGDGPYDPSMELHYPSEDAALDALVVLGWDIAAAGGRFSCPDCTTVLGCEHDGHEFTEWQRCRCGQLVAAHRTGPNGHCGEAFRYCQHCCLHESRPAPDDNEGTPYCASCETWLEEARDRASVTAHEHRHHGGAQTVWLLCACGCPEHEVHDLGHQEGCSAQQPSDGWGVA